MKGGAMDPRALLKRVGMGCLALAARDVSPASGAESQDADLLAGVPIVDAHAHPDQFFGSHWTDQSSPLPSSAATSAACSSRRSGRPLRSTRPEAQGGREPARE